MLPVAHLRMVEPVVQADHLTLFQPWGEDYAYYIVTGNPIFLTFLHPCLQGCGRSKNLEEGSNSNVVGTIFSLVCIWLTDQLKSRGAAAP